MPWNPQRYEAFADARLRPASDLLARIPLERPGRIADLGCGSGNATLLLEQLWPGAKITGYDNSAEMLEAARARSPAIEWQIADLASWRTAERFDLVFSNAALHWVDRHDALFPRLLDALAPAGVLAVQMPRNFAAPSHAIAAALACEVPFGEYLVPVVRTKPVLEPAQYRALLGTRAGRLDIWETEYLHVLHGGNPVADWTRSTLLVPLLDTLPERLRDAFESEYRRRVARAYPKETDESTLYPFRRLFLVATMA
jgi:trans-aconitate 2-methyltransferase